MIAPANRFVGLFLCAVDLSRSNAGQSGGKLLIEEHRQISWIHVGVAGQPAGLGVVDEQAGQFDPARQRKTGIVGELEEQQIGLTHQQRLHEHQQISGAGGALELQLHVD